MRTGTAQQGAASPFALGVPERLSRGSWRFRAGRSDIQHLCPVGGRGWPERPDSTRSPLRSPQKARGRVFFYAQIIGGSASAGRRVSWGGSRAQIAAWSCHNRGSSRVKASSAAKRLVHDQHIEALCTMERSQRRALPHAAGQFGRGAVRSNPLRAHHLQQMHRPVLAVRAGHPGGDDLEPADSRCR